MPPRLPLKVETPSTFSQAGRKGPAFHAKNNCLGDSSRVVAGLIENSVNKLKLITRDYINRALGAGGI